MEKEESILLPFVRHAVQGKLADERAASYSSVEESVQTMTQEHSTEGERFRRIAELTNNYTPPADACNTYKVTFGLLKEFEEDLHLHIHLENNILIPKAAAL
ncbi:hemerythrin domain-containing protein [Flammeovirgaceae bacterium SG7u.111]|nr:hemerythrin domain-containing protein [Flammeovirgaceae bacterium SG7u.132]WPO33467.1 hemerythrin domain-containing protein [Flammeovirgaceae bacterium SG7u.111]